MKDIIKVSNNIDQIKHISVEEHSEFYLVQISYEPRYGFGILQFSGGWDEKEEKSYHSLTIGNIDLYENINNDIDSYMNSPKTEIDLFFDKSVYMHFHEREKETDYIIFCKKGFFQDGLQLVDLNYE